MAASVYGGSPAHHNRIVHNSNGLSNSHNHNMSDGSSHVHPQLSHDPSAHYLQHSNFPNAIKHSTALSSIFVTQSSQKLQQQKQQQQQQPQHHQIPPQLPKKMRKNYLTISSGTLVHSGMINDSYFIRNSKRKSAVELLAESKPYYVKSENVLDRKQYQNTRSQLTTKSNSTVLSPNACKFCCLKSNLHLFSQLLAFLYFSVFSLISNTFLHTSNFCANSSFLFCFFELISALF